jgi:hypothetical protein
MKPVTAATAASIASVVFIASAPSSEACSGAVTVERTSPSGISRRTGSDERENTEEGGVRVGAVPLRVRDVALRRALAGSSGYVSFLKTAPFNPNRGKPDYAGSIC